MHITHIMGGIYLHMRTCARADVPLLRISGPAGRIALKFGVWVERQIYQAYYKSLWWGTAARAQPFFVTQKWLDGLRWYVIRYPLAKRFYRETHQLGVLHNLMVGYTCTCARAHVRTSFLYHRNDWMD